jgi:hypothetical protein
VQSPSGVELAGVVGLLVAVPAVAVLGNSGRRHTGAARRAHLILALGGALATAAALAGLLSALLTDAPVPRISLGSAVAVGAATGTLALLIGTALLPGAAESPGAALRHLLDGLVIAAAVWLVGWVLLSEPTRLLGDATPMACPSVLIPTALLVISLGLTVVLALHAHRPRLTTVRVAAGVTLVAGAVVAIAGGICQDRDGDVLAGSLLLPAGLFLIAHAVKTADRPVEVVGDLSERGTAYAVVPMVAIVTALGFHLSRGGSFGLYAFLGPASRASRWSAGNTSRSATCGGTRCGCGRARRTSASSPTPTR